MCDCLFVHGHVLFVCMSIFVCVCLPVLLMQYHYNLFESIRGDASQMYCIAVVSFDLSTHCDILYIFILLSFCIFYLLESQCSSGGSIKVAATRLTHAND